MDNKKTAKPPTTCYHQNLLFKDDYRNIECMDCDKSWQRKDGSCELQVFGDETRHSRWVTPKPYKPAK